MSWTASQPSNLNNESDKKVKGYLTQTYTRFARHCNIFKTLEEELKKEQHSSLSCLIIGPGLEDELEYDFDKYVNENLTKTYQPFELANVLINANISDYNIDIMDINPRVLDELKKTPTQLRIPLKPGYFQEDYQGKALSQKYHDSFFKNNTIHKDDISRIVEIPETVSSRIKSYLTDIVSEELPIAKYDVVICTVLLSHYSVARRFDELSNYNYGTVLKTLMKIEKSVKSGGYLIDSEKLGSDKYWDLIRFVSVDTPSVHSESTSLFRKK